MLLEHGTVNKGGQAIFGNVAMGEGGQSKVSKTTSSTKPLGAGKGASGDETDCETYCSTKYAKRANFPEDFGKIEDA